MSPIGNTFLGVLFVGLAFASTFLMYHLWGYPFDEESKKSHAPPRLMRLHRVMGYLFLAIYVALMWQMVPRLWTYQVELPARTVAHLLLGMSIGIILIIKIVIVRFFKHLESKLVPGLGTGLLLCTVLLIGSALPVSIREALLLRGAREGDAFSEERLERVRQLLPVAGLEDTARIAELASDRGLIDGRAVLRFKCTQCHDLRTILARPRTPDGWRQTVRRMAERSTVLNPIEETEQWEVTAYLIAVTPTLQATARLQRQQQQQNAAAMTAMRRVGERGLQGPYDGAAALGVFETRCSQCHSLDFVEQSPPRTPEEALQLVGRMVQNGLTASEGELAQIVGYLNETYATSADEQPAATEGETSPVPTDPERLFTFLRSGGYRGWSHEAARHASLGPHPVSVLAYVNPELERSLAASMSTHPAGAVAVKELFASDGELSGWAVSVKTAASSDRGNGWFWYEVLSTEEGAPPVAATNGAAPCIGCHAQGQDFVLSRFSLGSGSGR